MNQALAALIALAFLLLLADGPSHAADRCVLVKNGEPQAAIVLPPDATDVEKQATEVLQTYIEKMTGTRLPIGGDAETKVFIGWPEGRAPPVEVPATIERDGFLLEVTPEFVFIKGGPGVGPLNAVYTLLHELGCRWFMPGEIGEVAPNLRIPRVGGIPLPRLFKNDKPGSHSTAGELVVPLMTRQEAPDFEFRQIWYAWGASPEGGQRLGEWLRRNRCGGIRVAHGHNLTPTVPPSQYFEDHPEYYSLVDGERKPQQLCTTNPDVIRLVIERINRYFDENPTADSYSLCPDDNSDFCECPECTALDVVKSDPNYPDKPTVTDRLIHFMNQVASGIQKKHPGKFVSTYAYVNHSTPPVREEIDPHVIIVFTTSVFCSIHGIGDDFCASRQEMKRLLAEWAEKASRVYIYEYDPDPGNAELPCPLFGARLREMPVYRDLGIRGFSFETHDSWATLFPNFYVAARMMWDADQDPDELLSDICSRFFAESARPMLRYYRRLESAFSSHHADERWGHAYYPDCYTPQIVAACAEDIAEAQRLAKKPMIRKRVDVIARGFDYLQTYLDLRRRERGFGTREEFLSRYQRALDLITDLGDENEDYILARIARKDIEEWFAGSAAQATGDYDFVKEWLLIGPFPGGGRHGLGLAHPPEREINPAAAYPIPDGELHWAAHREPGWRGYVDLQQRFKPGRNDVVCAYALCWITAPEETKAVLRLGSNDSVVVWVGGREVWRNDLGRHAKIDEDMVPVTVPAGTTPILLKIGQMGGQWGFYFRVTDPEGKPIPSLRFSVEPPG